MLRFPYLLATFAAAWCLPLASGVARARVLVVDPDGLYTSVQAGIDSATTGDTLRVVTGKFVETPIIVDKDLSIVAAPGADVVLEAPENPSVGSAGNVVRVVRSRLVLERFTVRGARPPGSNGVMVFSGAVLMRDCKVEDCGRGVVAVAHQVPLYLEDCTVTANVVGVQGVTFTRLVRTRLQHNLLALHSSGEVELVDVEVSSNGGDLDGAGGLSLGGSFGTLERVHVHDNISKSVFGGIYMSRGPFRLMDCTVEDNFSAGGSSGVTVERVQSALFERCAIRRNRARGDLLAGGGLVVHVSGVDAIDCVIENNEGQEPGGGVSVQSDSGLRLRRSRVIGNRSVESGGGIFVSASFVEISDTIIAGNQAAVGGGVATVADGRVEMVQVSMVANRASAGAAIAMAGDRSLLLRSIIAGHQGPVPLLCESQNTHYQCVDIYGNSDDALCGIDAGGNLSVDPGFCRVDPEAGVFDLRLYPDSPVATGSCGRLGAVEDPCTTPTAATSITWSQAKSLFRLPDGERP